MHVNGCVNGPVPAFVYAATLMQYFIPSIRFGNMIPRVVEFVSRYLL